MDKIDKKILTILQKDCDISNQDLADKVSLSATPCLRRVKQLEEKGFIKKRVAILSQEDVGLQLTVLVLVGLDNHAATKMAKFEKSLQTLPEVMECHMIAGQKADYLLKVVAHDLEHYQKFLLKKLLSLDGVSNVQSNFALSKVVDRTGLPLDYV